MFHPAIQLNIARGSFNESRTANSRKSKQSENIGKKNSPWRGKFLTELLIGIHETYCASINRFVCRYQFWLNYILTKLLQIIGNMFYFGSITVKPDVLLMGTLQTSALTLVIDWQFESSKLQSARASCYRICAVFKYSHGFLTYLAIPFFSEIVIFMINW